MGRGKSSRLPYGPGDCGRGYLATGNAGPDLGILDQVTVVVNQATVDEDLVTRNLWSVTGNDDLSPVAFGIHGCLCPWVGTDDYPDPESSNMR